MEATEDVRERTVPLYSWWKTPGDYYRGFAIVNKFGSNVGGKYWTTHLLLLEWQVETPVTRSVEDFWDLVDRGQLIAVEPVWQPSQGMFPDAG
ncbi:hypothetical protein [Larkinella sp. C7]|jgi:hypothetical protein|uniref:hypothetical protein n=1 Tax=Larkinella sp. C7 TaxID=2576607 RepID=UPI0011114F07|nr:hypothetical protein [Larkinella sp. C7]